MGMGNPQIEGRGSEWGWGHRDGDGGVRMGLGASGWGLLRGDGGVGMGMGASGWGWGTPRLRVGGSGWGWGGLDGDGDPQIEG